MSNEVSNPSMRSVFVIEEFHQLVHAFAGVRAAGDPIPMIEPEAKLNIDGKSISLEHTKRFMLSDEIQALGLEFVAWCICKQIDADRFVLFLRESP